MFTRIFVKNYKSLIDLDVDLSSKKNESKSLIVIYGENGIGKSNFASIFYTLRESIETMSIKSMLQKLLNSNVEDENHVPDKLFRELLQRQAKDTESIIRNYKTINSEENMELLFEFTIGDKRGQYLISYDDQKIVEEKLDFALVKNKVNLYQMKNQKYKLNDNLFTDADYLRDFKEMIEQYIGKHSLLSLLSFEVEEKAESYVENKIHPELLHILNSLKKVSVKVQPQSLSKRSTRGGALNLLHNLRSGLLDANDSEKLNRTEKMLNEFFTTAYSDIKQVYYLKKNEKSNIRYELWIKKKIYGRIIDISFSQESSGTIQLLEIIPYLLMSIEGDTVVIDEIDTGIHDILIHRLLSNMSELIKGQLILTTHNTMLLDSDIDPQSIYVFFVDSEANKLLVPITNFENRAHPNLNYRNRYLKGMYGGVPIPQDIDFEELIEILE
ncbi:ATP/GTP-binding protein [Proteiniclasticum sp. C24MP]|uniref:AAA family ATPase n=1 Tax=Proteiniclasticum sp. C24MP TaxID=3374101 RepID=UPI003754C260